MFYHIVKYLQNVVMTSTVALSSVTPRPDRGGLRTSVYFWLTLLVVCQCLSGTPTAASTTRHWSLAELSVTSSELPKQIPPPPYPVQQRIQSTPHYDQQLKLPSGNGDGSRHQYYPWTRPTVSIIIWADDGSYRYNNMYTLTRLYHRFANSSLYNIIL